ncbi:MAG: Phage protein [Rhodospirillales bacterium]|nr:Phage protein [Rhodospirillales bacterium]
MGLKISAIQTSGGAGELAPDTYGRVDLAKYRAGYRVMRNFFTRVTGGASTRPGTQFIGRCKVTNLINPPQLIDFVFKTAQAYILEFGHLYMRVIMNPGTPGTQPGYVLEPSIALAGVTQATPGVFNVVAHGLSVGNQIVVAGALGMTAINSTTGFQLLIATVVDADHFTATDLDGNPINTAAYPAYTGGGTVARVFTLVTPYVAADVALVKYTQDADVMTLTHPSYAPQSLTRTQHWAWTLSAITFAASVQAPSGLTLTGGAATLDFYYVVTALVDATGEESVPTAAVMVTNAALNQTTGVNNSASWTAPATGPTPNRYNIYRSSSLAHGSAAPTIFGYIGQSTSLSFVDANFAPDFTNTPPSHTNPFAGGNNPGAVGYYQGREVYAGPNGNPNAAYTSKSGNFSNMDVSSPARDDDAITVGLTSQRVNAIKHLVSLNALLALSSDGAWQISGGSPGTPITPSNIVAQPQAYNGCNDVRPLLINYDVLHVAARGSHVRDLAYQFYLNIFTGDDKSVLSSHLFDGRQIVRWCYSDEPFKIVWACRDDGILLASPSSRSKTFTPGRGTTPTDYSTARRASRRATRTPSIS